MILLAAAGISLAATAVQWWNEGRLAEVEEDVDRLEAERLAILAADHELRLQLVAPYVADLRRAVARELAFRSEVRSELQRAGAQLREVVRSPFASLDRTSLDQLSVELEQATSRLAAEEAHLDAFAARLDGSRLLEAPPARAGMSLPLDYPREGGLLQLPADTQTLHGYHLEWDGRPRRDSEPVALWNVDHRSRRARACSVRGALVSAALSDDPMSITAVVREQTSSGVLLDFHSAPLLLPRAGGSNAARLVPGDKVDVYLAPAPLEALLRGPTRTAERDLLRVSQQRRVRETRGVWTPLGLRITADQLPAVTEAFEAIERNGHADRPFRLSLVEGTQQLDFALGAICLRVEVDAEAACFVLHSIRDTPHAPASIRFQAELRAFLPGQGDEQLLRPQVFGAFLASVDEELAGQKRLLIERASALELRKLSLIYRDQAEAERRAGAAGVFIDSLTLAGGRWVLDGILVERAPPDWLREVLASPRGASRLVLAGGDREFTPSRVELVDDAAGLYRFTVDDGNRTLEPSLRQVRRVVLATQGMQQEVLTRAIDDALVGRCASPGVRARLLSFGGDKVPHMPEASEALLDRALAAPDLFALWGPPGTGKTTLLVELVRRFMERMPPGVKPNLLLAGPTHVAVNELLGRIVQKVPALEASAVRYVAEEADLPASLAHLRHQHVLEGLRRHTSTMGGDSQLRKEWVELLRTGAGREAAGRWALLGRTLHAATCVGMARREFGLAAREFDLVIIDEAGKAFGAELLVPALRARKLVLAGDHRQLPPTVTTEDLDERIGYRLDRDEVEALLRTNFFGELFAHLPVECKGMLATQYRMHPRIGDAVSQLFYDGMLRSAPRSDRGWPPDTSRLVFVDFSCVRAYASRPGPDGFSQRNWLEARAAVDVLQELLRRHGTLPSTLVVCPYKAQRNEVADLLAQHFRDFDVTATTVDAVQGGEADLVLLLMTRTYGHVEFLLDRHRLNVALSRAREAVVLFGNANQLTAGEADNPVRQLLALDSVRHVLVRPEMGHRVGRAVLS